MQQWKSQSKSNNSSLSSLSKMMSQMDRKKVQAKAEQKPDEDYYKKLAEPRSQNYIRLVREQEQISAKMEQIEKKIQALEKTIGQSEVQETPVAGEVETATPREKNWWEEEVSSEKVEQKKTEWWEEDLPDMADIEKEKEQKCRELQRQKKQLEEQYEAMKQQLAESKRKLEQEFPVVSGRLGMIYPTSKQEKLLRYGVIAVPGRAYDSPAELLEQVQPDTEQAQKQWLKGDEAYHTYFSEELLNVEIYLYAICVIYVDGTSKVLRD